MAWVNFPNAAVPDLGLADLLGLDEQPLVGRQEEDLPGALGPAAPAHPLGRPRQPGQPRLSQQVRPDPEAGS